MNARQIALDALVRVYKSGGYSNIVIDKQLMASKLEERDKAFASALFYGVLERKITLDYCLTPLCSQKLRGLTPPVLAALELGAYQLFYMSHLPPSAVVNESVELVKKAGQPRAAGLVNGVLRAMLRAGCEVSLPEGPLALRCSVEYGVTQELASLLLEHYGEARTRTFLEASCGKAPVYIRVNTLKTSAQALCVDLKEENVTATAHAAVPDCLQIEGGGDLRRLKAFQKGLFHVQDAASQLCALCVDAKPGMRVADVCAAPGGKSFTIAQYMQDEGELFSFDLHENRVKLIEDGARRLDLSCLQPRLGDATRLPEQLEGLDRVLCDVPCSGFGIIRRKPEIRHKTMQEVSGLPEIQLRILESASQLLRPGGLLIYSTCSVNPVENSGVVEQFLARNPEFTPAELPELAGGGHSLTLLGEAFDSDGFFIAAIRRVD